MTSPIETLRELGFELPEPKPPLASYVPVTRAGDLLFISGQVSSDARGTVAGRLGDTMTVEEGARAAELAAVNLLAQIVHNAGVDLDRIRRVVKLTVFVAATPEFTEHHLVANGASNLIGAVLGDRGKHARSAVGVPSLPLGAVVEVEAIIEVEG